MTLIDFSTRRPVAVSMFTLALLLFGLVAAQRLGVTLLPDLSYPTATIRTHYLGAAPAEIETLISKPIEEALGLVRGVRRVSSVSWAGQSDVTLEFEWGTAMDFAVLDIREKLDPLELPKSAQRPLVLRVDPSSDPILRYGLTSSGRSAPAAAQHTRLRRIAEDSLQKPLEAVSGVAAVKVSGGLEDEIQVALDLRRLAQLELSSAQVIQRLTQENVNLSGGRVDEGSLRYLVRTQNQFQSLQDMRELILFSDQGRNIHLRDVATVTHGHRERTAIIRIDGEEAVELALFREGDGNTVAVVDEVRRRLDALAPQLPADIRLTPLYDQSRYIRDSIRGVLLAGLLGGALAILILYLFLADAWSTLVIGLAIPVSILASFILMYGAGLSLNIMSLGGLALAIGLLLDSAIVVLESIARKREAGLERARAARAGAAQVATAITASTLTTVAVFLPMVFVEGVAGQLFADQALVISGTLGIALLVALSLIPMLAARDRSAQPVRPAAPPLQAPPARRALRQTRLLLLETLPQHVLRIPLRLWGLLGHGLGRLLQPAARLFRRAFASLETHYTPALQGALNHRAGVLLLALGLFVATLLLLPRLGAELLPGLSQGEFSAELELDPGRPLAATDQLVSRLQHALSEAPQLRTSYAVSGTGNRLDSDPQSSGEHTAVLNLVLKQAGAEPQQQLTQQLRALLGQQAGLKYRFSQPTLFSLRTPLEIELAGHDLAILSDLARQVEAELRSNPRFTDIQTSSAAGQPEIQIRFDQARVAALGLQVPDLAERVVQAMQGRVATRYRRQDREIDVLVRASPEQRATLEDLRGLSMNPRSAAPVPLEALADIRLGTGPSAITRIDHQRVIVLSADLRHGALSEAVGELHTLLRRLPRPAGVSIRVTGQSEEMATSFRSLQLALGLAIFLVYLVMASQFESLLQPLVILLTIPLAAIGAVLALFFTGTVVNVVVLIGLIVLAGIVVNNGIVLIDRINQCRIAGLDRHAALLQACGERLRPILMTSLTTVLGLIPLALAQGQGAELRAPLAITVIGGLLTSTLLTLFVVPVVYSLVDRRAELADPPPARPGEPDPA